MRKYLSSFEGITTILTIGIMSISGSWFIKSILLALLFLAFGWLCFYDGIKKLTIKIKKEE